MGFYEWNERQNEWIARHPVRGWLLSAGILGAVVAVVHAVGDRPVYWPIVLLNVTVIPTMGVAGAVMRERRRRTSRRRD